MELKSSKLQPWRFKRISETYSIINEGLASFIRPLFYLCTSNIHGRDMGEMKYLSHTKPPVFIGVSGDDGREGRFFRESN